MPNDYEYLVQEPILVDAVIKCGVNLLLYPSLFFFLQLLYTGIVDIHNSTVLTVLLKSSLRSILSVVFLLLYLFFFQIHNTFLFDLITPDTIIVLVLVLVLYLLLPTSLTRLQ